ncbi:cation diffusion facilitator CzcD-associated flavoprotein CzcO [Azospirillum agricola]|uniref:flavin-containing monooxygenase n=1 Tax=Azospirillum agricola TaxID=1720247 RepID=UPI001AE95726|nr:NAD(P)/FAD-dependent oxidoreductase [Azospirillum agricola]MBP2231880.1 cation diffusion facilitator CzcD-associated flavoprotein CzcO [Azospirillum agricola]
MTGSHANALAALAAEARRSLALLGEEPANWVPARPGIDHDVAVIGGGQSGLSIAFALRRAGIRRTTVIDAAPPGGEGVWRSVARMETLRTAKAPPGPEIGIPALTFQAWHEALYGADAYAALGNVPRLLWADYLDWFRAAAGIPVRNGTRLRRVEPLDGGLRLHLERDGVASTETVRKLVLATGFAGGGGPFVPPVIADALPRRLYAHTAEAIDFETLRGRRVAILGAAASAFDAAGAALEAGAAEVHLFGRNADLTRGTRMKNFGYPAAAEHFHALSDAERWRVMRLYRARASFPPASTVRRAARFANFRLHLGAGWRAVDSLGGDAVRIATEDGRSLLVDFVIAGTGYAADLSRVPELAGFADRIARWGDRFTPEPGDEDAALGASPYLDPGFRFVETEPGQAPWLADIHYHGYSGMVSQGRPVGDIPSLRHNVPRLVSALGRDLFLADRERHLERMLAPTADDLTGEEYAHAVAEPV